MIDTNIVFFLAIYFTCPICDQCKIKCKKENNFCECGSSFYINTFLCFLLASDDSEIFSVLFNGCFFDIHQNINYMVS